MAFCGMLGYAGSDCANVPPPHFYGLERRAPVVVHAGENHGDRALLILFCDRKQEHADGLRPSLRDHRCLQAKRGAVNGHVLAGRHDEYAIRLEEHSLRYFHDRHRCRPGEDLLQEMGVCKTTVGRDHKRHAAVRPHRSENAHVGFEAAGRPAKADNPELAASSGSHRNSL